MSNRPVSGSQTRTGSSGPATSAEPDETLVARITVGGRKVEGEVALAKSRLDSDGVDAKAEAFAGTMTLGYDQVTVGGSVGHVDVTIDRLRLDIAAEGLGVKLNRGTKNADGSVGYNLGAQATLVGVEATHRWNGGVSHFTGGLSAGAGVEISVGDRDIDADNNPELCARVSVLVATVGFCIEY
ncbi:MAG TPA: hypothetical protein VGF45_06490 [Polyangia bacterium]